METQSNGSLELQRSPMEILNGSHLLNAAERSLEEFKSAVQQLRMPWFEELMSKLGNPMGKKSFLVFKSNKYINVLTENIAFFYIRYDSAMIMCFDRQEYFVNHSLEQIQRLVSEKQFYRINRQYLVNFQAIKEVEHYFARKLLVNPVVASRDKLVVPKEKVTAFLQWLDNR